MEYRTIGPKKGMKDGVDTLRVIDANGDAVDLIADKVVQDVGQQLQALHAQGKGKGLSINGTSVQG